MDRDTAEFWLTEIALGIAAVVLAYLLFVSDAGAHSWYSSTKDPVTQLGCCGGQDCRELPEDVVKETKGGYIYKPTGEFIPQSRVQPSRDWRFHRCEYMYNISNSQGEFKKGDTRCFFAPPGAS